MDKKYISFELRNLTVLVKRYFGKDHVHRHKHHMGREDRTTHIHMMALRYFLKNKDKDIFQRDFEKEFSIRRSTATNMLKRMEKQELLTRVSVPGDARLKKILLTDKALEIANKMDFKAQEFEDELTKGLTQEEKRDFLRILEKMKKNMEEKN